MLGSNREGELPPLILSTMISCSPLFLANLMTIGL
jgi:hypothetical protein